MVVYSDGDHDDRDHDNHDDDDDDNDGDDDDDDGDEDDDDHDDVNDDDAGKARSKATTLPQMMPSSFSQVWLTVVFFFGKNETRTPKQFHGKIHGFL